MNEPAWRTEFPVDVPQDNYVARRDFVKFLVLTSLGFVVGQVWIAVSSLLRRRRGRPAEVAIAKFDEVPVGGSLMFNYPGPDDPCLLLRPGGDTLLAYGQQCTHLSCAVVPEIDRNCLRCPCHRGEFDLATGRPLAGPPRRPLTRVQLEVREGVVYATGVERRTV